MIRFAKDKDMIRLREIWQAAFNDTREGTELIFETLNTPGCILVLTDGENDPVSMLCIREFALTSPLASYKAAYLYGVATDKEQRGKGYSTQLLEEAHKLLPRHGCVCSALVPSQQSLFDFYGARGYETAFYINKAQISLNEIESGEIFPLLPVTAEKYMQIRDSRFSDSKMFVCWSEEWISHVIRESTLYGGGMFTLTVDGKQLCVTCYRDGGTVYVKELGVAPAAIDAAIDAALRSIQAHFHPERMVLYLREDVQTSYTNNLLPFGMVKWYDDMVKNEISALRGAAPYIAHALD